MKTLTIVRHAKSSWGDASLDDFDRPLNSRGLRVAPQMGEALASRIGRPDAIISSTALRARTTAGIIAGKLGFADGDIIDADEVYLASTARLYQVLRDLDEVHASAMIFGHCPGVQDLANSLGRDAAIAHFPTCAAALFELRIEHWGEIDLACGSLTDFLVPKEILTEG